MHPGIEASEPRKRTLAGCGFRGPALLRGPAFFPGLAGFMGALLALHATPVRAAASAPDDTAELFKVTCAICHEVPETKAPPVDTIRQLPAARILMALEFGRMQPQAAGLTPDDVVKVNCYLTDLPNDFAAMNAVYATRFSAPYPARTTVCVAGLPAGARPHENRASPGPRCRQQFGENGDGSCLFNKFATAFYSTCCVEREQIRPDE